MKFILILTIATLSGTGGGSGVATAEFDSLVKCELAGEKWLSTSVQKLGHSARSRSSYICVEK